MFYIFVFCFFLIVMYIMKKYDKKNFIQFKVLYSL